MFNVSTTGGGMMTATIPDVCKVPAPPAPPIPVPMPNIGQVMQAIKVGCTLTVKVMSQAVILKIAKIPMSNGDQAGVAGGVSSSQIMAECKFISYSTTVKFEGQSVIYHTCQSQHNGSSANTTGIQTQPSQMLVKVSP